MLAFNLLLVFELLNGLGSDKSFLFLNFTVLMVHFDLLVEMYFGNTLNFFGFFAAE
jgi:hypothetical protein